MPTIGQWEKTFEGARMLSVCGNSIWLIDSGSRIFYRSNGNWVAPMLPASFSAVCAISGGSAVAGKTGDRSIYLLDQNGSRIIAQAPEYFDNIGYLTDWSPARIFVSQNDGDAWQSVLANGPVNWTVIPGTNTSGMRWVNWAPIRPVLVDTNGRVFTYSDPTTNTWQPYSEGIGAPPPLMANAAYFNAGRVIALGQDGNIYEGGFSQPFWRNIGTGPALQQIFCGDPQYLWGIDNAQNLYRAPITL